MAKSKSTAPAAAQPSALFVHSDKDEHFEITLNLQSAQAIVDLMFELIEARGESGEDPRMRIFSRLLHTASCEIEAALKAADRWVDSENSVSGRKPNAEPRPQVGP